MASFRTGPGGTGAGESGPYFEPFDTGVPSNSRLRTSRNEFGVSHERSRTIPQPKGPSRLPQSLPLRRPSYDQAEQSYLDRKHQPRNSIGGGNSTTVSSNISNPSTSISSKLPALVSKRRNVLRRKNSGLAQETSHSREGSRDESSRRTSSSASNPHTGLDAYAGSRFDRNLTTSPMEIRVAQQMEVPKTTAQTVTIYPELDRYRDMNTPTRHGAESPGLELPPRIATHDLPPPTPLFSGASSLISGFSGSPSTRFSGSPGPGPYSRDTTPTSISSQSPGLVAPMRIPTSVARMRQIDTTHTRPPISRRRTGSISNDMDSVSAHTQGLAAVRESLTSSSSSSNATVREADRKDQKKSKKNKLAPPPPSPPPRKSSQKFNKNRDEDESPSKSSREPAQPLMTSPPKPIASSYSRPRPRPTQSQSAPSVPTVQTLTTQPAVSPKPTPPIRPSRDGAPDLHSQVGLPIPIIHSNLSTTSLSERRQSSQFPPAPAPASLAILSTSAPERPSYLARAPLGREPTPAPVMNPSKPPSGRSTRTPSPSVSAFRTRFPLFGRKSKPTAAEPPAPAKPEKPARKGPAAGTGHEGYGRLGSVRRRSNSNSVATPGRAIPGTMSSQETLGSNVSHDPFLAERMAPVVIAGGEVIENRNTSSELFRTESNQSFSYSRPSVDSRNSSQVSLSSREGARHTLWPSPFPRPPSTKAPSIGSRRPSGSSDSEALVFKSSLAVRRSMQRLKSGEQEAPRIPKPIVTRAQVVSPSMTSADASIMSDDSVVGPSASRAVRSKEVEAPKKLLKRARSPRKWNFFSRSHSQPAEEKKKEEKPSANAVAVAAAVKVVPSKPVPFYAMMDSSEQEDTDAPDLGQILRKAKKENAALLSSQTTEVQKRMSSITRSDPAPPAPPSGLAILEDPAHQQIVPRKQQQPAPAPSVNFPKPLLSPPQPVTVPGPSSSYKKTAPPAPKPSGRPSRLPQVGRIPKVVSARAEQISPKSFSRPFHRLSYQTPILTVNDQDAEFVAKGPSPPKISTPELTQDGSTTTTGTNASAYMFHTEPELPPSDPAQADQEFLSFSPRKGSQGTTTTTATTSSTSSGGLFAYANATAVIPDRYTPLAEDEIWDEYNDLLGEDTMRVLPSARQSLAKGPTHQTSSKAAPKHALPALESPTVNTFPMQSLNQALEPPSKEKEPVTSSIYSLNFGEKIKQALDIDYDPASCVTSFYESESPCSGEGADEMEEREPTTTTTITTPAHNNPPIAQQSQPQPPTAESNLALRQHVRQSDASGSSFSSTASSNSPISQVNLRVGSMTVSKWLTFGHVLFSPVREELIPLVGSLKRHSILVIDGLGNDDWSFYAAETYPAATFFNLSPRAPPPPPSKNQASSAFPQTPPNHHQVQYTSHLAKFPFGPSSFTAVVFRFPAAAPESHYRNIVSEARRVLKPGGFIELSILDVDLNNMGNRGRRAIRRLKERIHAKAPDTSLGSTSDLMLRLLGRKGFGDIKTCRVGVPVAGLATGGIENNNGKTRSRSGSLSEQQPGQGRRASITAATGRSHSRNGSYGGNGKEASRSRSRHRHPKQKDDRSLPEMINDEGPVADENITNMVAKVGRWWYSRCYESAADATTSRSGTSTSSSTVWRDRALLAECEEWGTSLKLMVCHARVPSVARVASI